MSYELLIEAEYVLSKDQYPELLGPNEMPRGSEIPITYYITNIGNKPFKGNIKNISTSFNISPQDGSIYTQEENPTHNSIENQVNERIKIHESIITMVI